MTARHRKALSHMLYRVRHKFWYIFVRVRRYLFWIIRMASCASKETITVALNQKHHNQSHAIRTSIAVFLDDKHQILMLQTSSLIISWRRWWTVSHALGRDFWKNVLSSKFRRSSWGRSHQGFYSCMEKLPQEALRIAYDAHTAFSEKLSTQR